MAASVSSSSGKAKGEVQLLNGVYDNTGGVVVQMTESMDSKRFASLIKSSLSHWKQEGKKGVWIKIPIELVNLVEVAVKEGFWHYHEEPTYLMLVHWIPGGANNDREQKFFSQMPYHAVFRFLIPLLLEALQAVKDQGTNLWVFLLATIVYCFACVADIKSQDYNTSYAQLYSLVAVISGSLSSVSLISLFLPELPGRLIFIPWAFVLSIVVFHRLIKRLCCWLYQMIMKTFLQAVGIWNRFKGSGLTEQPRLPV